MKKKGTDMIRLMKARGDIMYKTAGECQSSLASSISISSSYSSLSNGFVAVCVNEKLNGVSLECADV